MQKLMINQDVYIITEAFKKMHPADAIASKYYEIVKCKVTSIPQGNFKEYKLLNGGDIYWKQRQSIYELYDQAVEAANRIADKYDNTWSKFEPPIYRPWKESR